VLGLVIGYSRTNQAINAPATTGAAPSALPPHAIRPAPKSGELPAAPMPAKRRQDRDL